VFPPHYTEAVLATLRTRRVPYVITAPFFIRPNDRFCACSTRVRFRHGAQQRHRRASTLWLGGRNSPLQRAGSAWVAAAMNGAQPRPRAGWLDVLLPAVLFVATTLYVAAQPRNLAPADESVYLYEAKRVLEGAVLYRDVFEITTPGWLWLMAALFRIFGVDLATARLTIAILHGVTAVFLYGACRRLAIRPGLAWLPALAYLVVSQPAWPIASQHWLGTLLTVLLLWICAAVPGADPAASAARPARWALWPGVVIGLLIGVHQQRGVLVGAGIVLWLIADRYVQRRHRVAQPVPALTAQLAWIAIGAALVVVPMGIVLVASAGFEPVWQALIVHPLFQYRGTMRSAWGQSNGLVAEAASYTFPRLLKYLPAILIVDVVRFAVLEGRRAHLVEARRLLFLIVSCATAVLSITYFPDYIHIAFIAPRSSSSPPRSSSARSAPRRNAHRRCAPWAGSPAPCCWRRAPRGLRTTWNAAALGTRSSARPRSGASRWPATSKRGCTTRWTSSCSSSRRASCSVIRSSRTST
jgi:hypothetical protein